MFEANQARNASIFGTTITSTFGIPLPRLDSPNTNVVRKNPNLGSL